MKFKLTLRFMLLLAVIIVGAALGTYPIKFAVPDASAQALPAISLTSPISGFSRPVTITHAGDGSGRLFVVEQGGRIRIVRNGAILSTPFLDIIGRVNSSCFECGLLGLAFPPGYSGKGYFYVNYTRTSGETLMTVIARYRITASPDVADPNSEQIILTINQPFANHNGGQLAFGPRDGYLYIGMGDGGSGGDPQNRAQNPADLLGKMLRIDVETGNPATYTIPATNPFINRSDYRGEIWALGMRNPWRFSFDRQTHDLYIADVGQNAYEEVNYQPATSSGGENYGWRIMEGNHCFNPNPCSTTGLTLPVVEYDRSLGCSVTGGYVYRGPSYPNMQGLYFYGDYCSGRIWGLRREGSAWQNTMLIDTDLLISSFGEDEQGGLYVADHQRGIVHMITDTSPPPTPTPTPTPAPTPAPPPVQPPAGLQYYPLLRPIRLLDTRPGETACDTPGTPLRGGEVRTQNARLTCTGITIPANAQAIVGNATVVNTTPNAGSGFVTLYTSGGAARPTVSNLNYTPGQVVPNSFTVSLGPDGAFNIYALTTLHFIVDITGYYAPPGSGGLYYHPLPAPVRLLDTRPGQPACDNPGNPLTAGVSRTEFARGACSGAFIPSNAQAIVGNATVVNDTATGAGYVTLYPSAALRPIVSNLNYTAGQVVANSFTVRLGDDGAFSIYALTSTHFIVDIVGYYSDQLFDLNTGQGNLYYPLASPIRLLDTRPGEPACETTAPRTPFGNGETRTFVAHRTCGVMTIPGTAEVIVGNATVVNNTAGAGTGFVTFYPSNVSRPTVSNLNYVPGQVVPNSFVTRLDPNGSGSFNVYALTPLNFIIDITGYFAR